jgi:hypothetical protein
MQALKTSTMKAYLCAGANMVMQHTFKSRTRQRHILRGRRGCSSALMFLRSMKTRSIEVQSRYAFGTGIRAEPPRHLILEPKSY